MAKKKVELADVLWDAANRELSPTRSDIYSYGEGNVFSCCAVGETLERMICKANWYLNPTMAERQDEQLRGAVKATCGFLKALGCPVKATRQTFGQEPGEARQGVRYMWLLLAMHVAEDEGIEIEVEA